jgi:hypothetical protein
MWIALDEQDDGEQAGKREGKCLGACSLQCSAAPALGWTPRTLPRPRRRLYQHPRVVPPPELRAGHRLSTKAARLTNPFELSLA